MLTKNRVRDPKFDPTSDSTVRLMGVSPKAFDGFIDWLMHHSFTQSHPAPTFLQLCQIYKFGFT